jgi:hypothetical protein
MKIYDNVSIGGSCQITGLASADKKNEVQFDATTKQLSYTIKEFGRTVHYFNSPDSGVKIVCFKNNTNFALSIVSCHAVVDASVPSGGDSFTANFRIYNSAVIDDSSPNILINSGSTTAEEGTPNAGADQAVDGTNNIAVGDYVYLVFSAFSSAGGAEYLSFTLDFKCRYV